MLDKDQDSLRQQYINFIQRNGIKESIIADRIGVHRTSLYRWKSKQIRFSYDNYVKLNNFMLENNLIKEKGDDKTTKAE